MVNKKVVVEGFEPSILSAFDFHTLCNNAWTLSSSVLDAPCKVSTLARSFDLLARRYYLSIPSPI